MVNNQHFVRLASCCSALMQMKNNDGKYLEKLVQLIEKSIDPNAIIDHDVQMPILTSQIGATTQCDVVIKTGTPFEKP